MRIVTPGTLTDSALLEEKRDSLLLALHQRHGEVGPGLAQPCLGHILRRRNRRQTTARRTRTPATFGDPLC